MKKLSFLTTFAVTSVLGSLSVFAEEDANTIYIKRGQSEVITPTGFESSGIDTPISMSVITPEEIKVSGASNVIEVLRGQIGVQFRNFSSDSNRAFVSMRGFGGNAANNVLIVVDGRKLNNHTLEAANLNFISLKDIERIEVIQGSGGVLFGDQAVGGVINIITKKIVDDRASIAATHGTDDLKKYTFEGAKKFDNGLSFRMSAESRTADNYRDSNEANYDDVFARVNLVKEWGELYLERGYVSDKLNLPGSLNTTQLQENRRQVGSASRSNSFVNIERFGADFYLGDDTIWQTDLTARDANGEGFGSMKDTRLRSYHTKLLTQWDTGSGKAISTSGYEFIDNDYQRGTTRSWANEQISLYTQLVYPLASKVNAVVGVRQAETRDQNVLSSLYNEHDETVTEFGLNYRLGGARFFLRSADGVRFANADENGTAATADAFLFPQKSNSYETGIEFSNDKVRVNALIYQLKLDDEIYYDSVLTQNVNLDSSKRDGVTLEVDYSLNNKTSLGAGYSYIDAKYTAGSFEGNDVPGVASDSATVYIDHQLSDNLRLFADAVYTGSQFLNSDDANSFGKLTGYTVVNFNAAWSIDNSTINFRINNLMGREYVTYQSQFGAYPAAEREIQVTYTYNFE